MIGMDDTVHTRIPAWKNLGVYASGMPSLLPDAPPSFLTTPTLRPMKIVDLATHTSGLTYGFMMRTAVDAAYRRTEAIRRGAGLSLTGARKRSRGLGTACCNLVSRPAPKPLHWQRRSTRQAQEIGR